MELNLELLFDYINEHTKAIDHLKKGASVLFNLDDDTVILLNPMDNGTISTFISSFPKFITGNKTLYDTVHSHIQTYKNNGGTEEDDELLVRNVLTLKDVDIQSDEFVINIISLPDTSLKLVVYNYNDNIRIHLISRKSQANLNLEIDDFLE